MNYRIYIACKIHTLPEDTAIRQGLLKNIFIEIKTLRYVTSVRRRPKVRLAFICSKSR